MTAERECLLELYEMLPEAEQHKAYEAMKNLVLAWDPDFTKLTKSESVAYNAAIESGFVDEEDINWDEIGI